MLMSLLVSSVLLLAPMVAFSQSSPNFTTNQHVLADQWNAEFSSKVDVNNGSLSNPSLTGGHIDNTLIGGTTPSSGSFSSLSASTSLLVPRLSATLGAAGNIGYNTSTGRFDFGIGGGVVNFVRRSGDSLTGALHMGTNTIDGSAIAFSGGTLSGLTSVDITGPGTSLSVSNNAAIGGVLSVNPPSDFPGTGQYSDVMGSLGSTFIAVPSTFGRFQNCTGFSVIVNSPGVWPGCTGFASDSAIATYSPRDSVAIFVQNQTRAPTLTLSSPTYDATHIFPATALNPSQVASIRIGAFIDTNASPKYSGRITAVAGNGTSITVSGWYRVGNTAAGQIATGTTALVDVMTTAYDINTVTHVSNIGTNPIGGTVHWEADTYNDVGTFAPGTLTNAQTDNPSTIGLLMPCETAAPATCGAAIWAGGFYRGVVVDTVPTGGAAFVAAMSPGGRALVVTPENDTPGSPDVPSVELDAGGVLSLGDQGDALHGGTINLYSSGNGNGVIDTQIVSSGGTASAFNGLMQFGGAEYQFYGPTGAAYVGLSVSGAQAFVQAKVLNDTATNADLILTGQAAGKTYLGSATSPVTVVGSMVAAALATSCTSQPTGTLWKNGTAVSVCP